MSASSFSGVRTSSVIAGVLALLVMAPFSVVAQGDPVSSDQQSLKIGIIGSGSMGSRLGLHWIAAGHEVLFSSRNPDQLTDLVEQAGPRAQAGFPQEAAEFGEVILLALPPGSYPQIAEDYGHLMRGKVVLDVGNPREDRDGPLTSEWLARGTGLVTAEFFPSASVVKALNAIGAGMLDSEAHRTGERVGIPVAGDDMEAVAVVSQLVRDAGFDPVYVGPLERSVDFDRGTPAYELRGTARQLRELLDLPSGP